MIVEEKKACDHWCPHVRHPGEEGGTFNRGFEAGNEINTGRTSGNWLCACIGSRCMAWRWADIPNPAWRPPNLMYQLDPLGNSLTIKSDTEGYCGLAGRP